MLFFLLWSVRILSFLFFFFNDTATTEIYTFPYTTLFRSLLDTVSSPEDSNPQTISYESRMIAITSLFIAAYARSEEHTSELQSQSNLVCRLLLEKKKKNNIISKEQLTTTADAHYCVDASR